MSRGYVLVKPAVVCATSCPTDPSLHISQLQPALPLYRTKSNESVKPAVDHLYILELEGVKLPLYKVAVQHLLTPRG